MLGVNIAFLTVNDFELSIDDDFLVDASVVGTAIIKSKDWTNAKVPTVQNGKPNPPMSYKNAPREGPKQEPIPKDISVHAIMVVILVGKAVIKIVILAFQAAASAIPDKNLRK